MFRVLTCLTVEHDWRLVAVAAVICLFASLTAVNLFNRARATAGRARALWIARGCDRHRLRNLGYALCGNVGL